MCNVHITHTPMKKSKQQNKHVYCIFVVFEMFEYLNKQDKWRERPQQQFFPLLCFSLQFIPNWLSGRRVFIVIVEAIIWKLCNNYDSNTKRQSAFLNMSVPFCKIISHSPVCWVRLSIERRTAEQIYSLIGNKSIGVQENHILYACAPEQNMFPIVLYY